MFKINDDFKLMKISQILYLWEERSNTKNSAGRRRFPKPGGDGDPQRHLGGDIAAGEVINALNRNYNCVI